MEEQQRMIDTVLEVLHMLEDETVDRYICCSETMAAAKGVLARLVIMISNATKKENA